MNDATNALRILDRIERQTVPVAANWLYAQFGRNTARYLQRRPYAPKRPNQRYVRTGRFGRAWSSGRSGNTGVKITNRAQQNGRIYPGYVVGDGAGQNQAGVHRGRWDVYRDVVDKEARDNRKELELELARKVVR